MGHINKRIYIYIYATLRVCLAGSRSYQEGRNSLLFLPTGRVAILEYSTLVLVGVAVPAALSGRSVGVHCALCNQPTYLPYLSLGYE